MFINENFLVECEKCGETLRDPPPPMASVEFIKTLIPHLGRAGLLEMMGHLDSRFMHLFIESEYPEVRAACIPYLEFYYLLKFENETAPLVVSAYVKRLHEYEGRLRRTVRDLLHRRAEKRDV